MVDPAHEQAIVNQADRAIRKTRKLLGKNAAALQASLDDDESVVSIVGHGGGNPELFNHVLAVTNRRLLDFKRGRLAASITREEIGRTRVFNPASTNRARWLIPNQ